MSPEEGKQLANLLEKLVEDNCFVPEVAWDAWQKVAVHTYNEIVIAREMGGVIEFLLTRRPENDPEFPGRPWHIPGSRWKPWRRDRITGERIPLKQAEACALAAKGEFGVSVEFVVEVGTHFWDEFSYRYPISHICYCKLMGDVEESDELRFFSIDRMPEPIIKTHIGFLKRVQEFLERR